jgi:hypothetical protein
MNDTEMLSGETPSLVEDALAVLRAVFNCIPTFWGTSELASVFRLYFDTLALGSTGEIGSFARRVASKAPTAVLLSTYFETWPSISCAQAGVSRTWVIQVPFVWLRSRVGAHGWLFRVARAKPSRRASAACTRTRPS